MVGCKVMTPAKCFLLQCEESSATPGRDRPTLAEHTWAAAKEVELNRILGSQYNDLYPPLERVAMDGRTALLVVSDNDYFLLFQPLS